MNLRSGEGESCTEVRLGYVAIFIMKLAYFLKLFEACGAVSRDFIHKVSTMSKVIVHGTTSVLSGILPRMKKSMVFRVGII